MKLYNFPWGPYPRRLAYYLSEKGLHEIDFVEVEFPHKPELWPPSFLLDLDPAHSLPVLETSGGVRIGQSLAIIEYLEERLPSPNLLGATPEDRARTREMAAIFDEAAAFFGLWARHGSQVNAGRHLLNIEAAHIGAERYTAKLRVAERLLVGPFLCGDALTIADCVAMALLEFTDQFYGVPLPADCTKLLGWFARFSRRSSAEQPSYPPEMLRIAHGLPEQSQFFV